jgi:hypothetical protein
MNHPWLHQYPIEKTAEFLILGTHPPMPDTAPLKYYYGNVGEFWRILDGVYPGEGLFVGNTVDLAAIESWQKKYRVAITDVVAATNGQSFNTDKDMVVTCLNTNLLDQLGQSNVHTIYSTSFAGKNNALSLFRRLLKENGHRHLRIPDVKEWHADGLSLQLGEKKYTLHALYSPSPMANIAAPKIQAYQDWKAKQKEGVPNSYFDFRVWWYAQRLPARK